MIVQPQADHPNCLRHRDVTCDIWSHTFIVFHNARTRLHSWVSWSVESFIKHRILHNWMKTSAGLMNFITYDTVNVSDHMSGVTSRCLEQFRWSACRSTVTKWRIENGIYESSQPITSRLNWLTTRRTIHRDLIDHSNNQQSLYHQLIWYNSLWLRRWQSLSTTVLRLRSPGRCC